MATMIERTFREAADVTRFVRRAFAGKTFDGARYGTVEPDYAVLEDGTITLSYHWDDGDWLNDATATLIAAVDNRDDIDDNLYVGEMRHRHYGCEARWQLEVADGVRVQFYTANADGDAE